MVKEKRSLALILTLVAGMVLVPPAMAAPPQPENPQPISQGDMIDIGPVLRAQDAKYMADLEARATAAGVDLSQIQIRATAAYTTGDTITWLALDEVDPMGKNFAGDIFETDYEVKAVTEYCEVWVQKDLNYYNADGTINRMHPDARDPLYVTDARINYLADQCNTTIRPTDVSFFGPYLNRDGTQGFEALINTIYGTHLSEVDGKDDRLVILVSNIRDDNFYDPISNRSFIGGFYWGTFNAWGDRNFVSIDTKQWNDRVGASGHPTRAYDFDSTIAHELQHLIHSDQSPNEETWLNEAMSGFAEFLNGYYTSDALAGRTQWQTWPENSVTLWGDQNNDQGGSEILADYQLVNAFALYTTGRIGGVYTDTAKLTQESEDGILGFNKWLSDTSATNPAATGLTFDDIFTDFRRDMLFGGDTNGAQPQANWNANFIDAYHSPLENSGGPATVAASLGRLRDNLDREGYDWPGAPPFGTDFVEICWSEALSTTTYPVTLDGDETAPPTAWSATPATDVYSPTSGSVAGDVLYSGHSDLSDNFVVFGPVTPGGGDQLTFNHYYNIEDDWDYGFVQVTTDTTGMVGWTSLPIAGTQSITDADAHAIIKANVPGFSGFSGGWITSTYNIGAAYGGQPILLAFRYATDWASDGSDPSSPSGWALDNVSIGSTTLTSGAVGGGRSIQEVRGAGNRFALEFLTWDDGDAITVANVHTATLSAAMTGTLDLATSALGDAGFDEAGERGVLMVSLTKDVFDDLIAGGLLVQYADYSLTGLLPSICTSDANAYGVTHAGADRVYAGEVVTVAVHADNVGSSPNITTTGPLTFYVGVETPVSTTFLSATGGAAPTADLSTVSASFPATPGVYWVGSVARTYDFDVAFTADADLVDGELITATVHFADGAGTDQYFQDESAVTVVSAFGLSALGADIDPVWPGTPAQFTAKILNLSSLFKPFRLVADHPADTTFLGVTGATNVVASATQVTITQVISPYATSGATDLTFRWQPGSSYTFGDVITSTMVGRDTTTGEVFNLSATAAVDAAYRIRMPIVMRGYTP